jgi:hypothetical protein
VLVFMITRIIFLKVRIWIQHLIRNSRKNFDHPNFLTQLRYLFVDNESLQLEKVNDQGRI